MDIVRNGEREATNDFFSIGDAQNVLELTYNHDGRAYDLGTAYGHIAIGVDDLDGTLATLASEHGIEPSDRRTRSRRAARGSASFAPRRLPHRAHRTPLSLGSSDTSQSSPLGGCRRKARNSRTSYALLTTPATRNGAPSETCRIGAATSGPSGRVT